MTVTAGVAATALPIHVSSTESTSTSSAARAEQLLDRATALDDQADGPSAGQLARLNGEITQLLRDPAFNADRLTDPEVDRLAGQLAGLRQDNAQRIDAGSGAQSPAAIAGWTAQAGNIVSGAARALSDGRVDATEARDLSGRITQLLTQPDFNAAERFNPELKALADQLRQARAQFDQSLSGQPMQPTSTVKPSTAPASPSPSEPPSSTTPSPTRPEINTPRCPSGLRC